MSVLFYSFSAIMFLVVGIGALAAGVRGLNDDSTVGFLCRLLSISALFAIAGGVA